MAKAFTKTQTVATLADLVGITRKQSAQYLDELAQLAYTQAGNSFKLPGLGKLELADRKAHVGRNLATGEAVKIEGRRVVKFRVTKAARVAILRGK
jgi:DNA-binding protein HU-beta